MSDLEEQVPEKGRRRAGNWGRGRYLMTIVAVGLGGVLSLTLAPRALSGAATVSAAATPSAAPSTAPNDDGVTWNPDGALTQVNDGTGDCAIDMTGTVSAPGSSVIAAIQADLPDEPEVNVGSNGIGSLSAYAFPVAAGATSVQVRAGASVDCSLVNQTDAYLKKTGGGSLGHAVGLVLDSYLRPGKSSQLTDQRAYAALPSWLRGAIAAITSSIIFVAVSAITTATLVAFGAATGPAGALASPALAAFTGCFAGVISRQLSNTIFSNNDGILSGIGSLIQGCFTGGAIKWLRSAMPWIDVMLNRLFSNTIAAIVGPVANRALAAQVELPIQAAWHVAEEALAEP